MARQGQKPQALAGPGASAGNMQPRERKFSLPSRECTFLASGSFGKSAEKALSTEVGPHAFKTSAVPFSYLSRKLSQTRAFYYDD